MKKLLFVTLALFGLSGAVSTANAAECSTVDDLNLLVWSQDSSSLPAYSAKIEGIYEKHCLNVTLVPVEATSDMSNRFKDDDTIDGSLTFEGPASIMKDIDEGRFDGEAPKLLGSFAGSLFRIVGTVPLSELVSQGDNVKIVATGRCSDIDLHPEDGMEYRDITDPATETYTTPPSSNTVEKLRMFRSEIGKSWPAETRIICGNGFSEKRPNIDGPVVWIEAVSKSSLRREGLVEGKFAATSLWLEHYYSLKHRANLIVYEREPGVNRLPAIGIFAKPSVIEAKKAAFCRLNQALAETNAGLLGSDTKKAFEQFERSVNLDVENPLKGALTIKNQDGTGEDVAATKAVREGIFNELRETVWKADLKPTNEDINLFFDWFGFKADKKSFSVDPCS